MLPPPGVFVIFFFGGLLMSWVFLILHLCCGGSNSSNYDALALSVSSVEDLSTFTNQASDFSPVSMAPHEPHHLSVPTNSGGPPDPSGLPPLPSPVLFGASRIPLPFDRFTPPHAKLGDDYRIGRGLRAG